MKLTILLIVINVVNCLASVYSQKVSLHLNDVKLSEALNEISKQTSLDFAYSKNFVDLNRTVTISVSETELNTVLDKLFEGTNLSHIVLNGKIYLGPNDLETVLESSLQQKKVTGTITDAATGETLPGVSILIEGTSMGAISDLNGSYSIDVPGDEAVLVFSFVGYMTEKITVGTQQNIDVKLVPEAKTLEELVVVGYGTQRRIDLTGSVASVKGEELTKVNASSVSNAVAGRLPGLQVTQSSGAPGAGSSFRVRGMSSVNASTVPLVLIDGFEGNENQVAPEDVESVSLLKDASSAAIYGARAANGVILITTKRGAKNQPLRFEVKSQAGYQSATRIPEILNSVEWARKMNESTQARSSTQYWTGNLAPENQTTNTNWLDYIFQNAAVQDYSISAYGGAEKLRYSVKLGYFDQDGIIIGENYKRANVRANLDYITDKYSLGVNINQFRSWFTSTLARNVAMPDAFRTPPTIPVTNPDGMPGTARRDVPGENTFNDWTPYMDANARDDRRIDNATTANLYFELKLWKGLKYKGVFNANLNNNFNEEFRKQWVSYYQNEPYVTTSIFRQSPMAGLYDSHWDNYKWELQNLLMYDANFNNHHIDVLAGISAQKENSNFFWGSANNFSRNDLIALDAGSQDKLVGGSPGEGSLYSQFGRVNYSYRSKYLAQINIRRDGSSNFSPKNRFGVFPSASVGWRISEENFLKGNPTISNLKLRAGYGSLGNAFIPAFRWLSNISFNSYVFGANQTRVPASSIDIAYNAGIQWETVTTTNIGVDLGLFNNKLNITAERFLRKTTDMLFKPDAPATLGVWEAAYLNLGAVENNGWEFVADYQNTVNKFNYGVSFNVTFQKNEVTDMGGLKPLVRGLNGDIWIQQGQPINSYYGYEVAGIWQNQSEIDNAVKTAAGRSVSDGAKPGDFRFKDLNGDSVITANDRKFIGSSIPRIFYGANLFANWKGIDVSVLIQGEADKDLLITPEYGMDFGTLYDQANMYKEVYDKRWKGDGDDSYYPALGSTVRGINRVANTRWVQDASYLRVKSIQIGYTLPKQLTSRWAISQLRIFATASNLFTFTKYPGFDPEMDQIYTRGGADYPQAKIITGGINIIF